MSTRLIATIGFALFTVALARSAGAQDIIVCEHARYEGRCLVFNHGVSNLRDFGLNDEISSFRIRSGAWLMCLDADFEGRCEVFDRSVQNLSGTAFQDSITSLRPLRRGESSRGFGRSAIAVWVDTGFRGRSAVFSDDVSNLKDFDLNDEISSLRVLGGRWEVCADSRFRKCVEVQGEIRNLREIGLNDEISSIRQLEDRPEPRRGRSRRY
ncbi:MAG TPA: beta/gamma crystallin-related protein [Xanthomonadaceae bacterium]|nr:beta/gamma crystallin-related protein [Xanthomonadaceae bacterium]